jgi:transposase-like protein
MDEREEAVAMALGGVKMSDIATELQCTTAEVERYLRESDAFSVLRKERDQRVIEAYEDESNSILDVLTAVDPPISNGTLYSILHKHNVVLRRGECNAESRDARIVRLYREGHKIRVIRDLTGVSNNTIYRALDHANVERRRSKQKGMSKFVVSDPQLI